MSSIIPTTNTLKLLDTKTRDRISALPDSVLQHIISFLPTKHAVATSVLSSRWEYVWTLVPVLKFKVSDVRQLYSTCPLAHKRFVNFVDRVLFLHNLSNVSKFFLSCKAPDDLSRLNSWITTAIIKCKLQELNLRVVFLRRDADLFVFPRCLFTHESLSTLVSLQIRMICVLKLPGLTHFLKLNILHLNSVTFSTGHSTQQVLFDFPSLQDFHLVNFGSADVKTIIISAPKLKRLTINDGLKDTSALGCQINVYAESLVSLELHSPLLYDYSLLGLSSLVEAHVNIYDCFPHVDDHTVHVTKLLGEISNAKDLTVTTSIPLFQALSVPDLLTLRFVINLTILVPLSLDFRDLLSLLNILPNLEFLHIDNEICIHDEEDWTLTTMSKCLSHLKSVQLDVFNGNADELHVISFLLKNTTVLDRMTVVASEDLCDDKQKYDVTRQLLLASRGSTQCIIDFS